MVFGPCHNGALLPVLLPSENGLRNSLAFHVPGCRLRRLPSLLRQANRSRPWVHADLPSVLSSRASWSQISPRSRLGPTRTATHCPRAPGYVWARCASSTVVRSSPPPGALAFSLDGKLL